MKIKNVKFGMKVIVKNYCSDAVGQQLTIDEVDFEDNTVNLSNGYWYCVKDVKKVKVKKGDM